VRTRRQLAVRRAQRIAVALTPPGIGFVDMGYLHILLAPCYLCSVLAYIEDGHSLDRPASEAEMWVHVGAWLRQYTVRLG